MATGFIIGIPLFYIVGFVLVVPLIFSVVYRYKFPAVYIGLPMLASLSVTHGFLPPHPSPTYLVAQFNADMGQTLLYGIMVGIPTVIIAGPLFSRTVRRIRTKLPDTFKPTEVATETLPGLWISIFSALLPVILLALTTVLRPYFPTDGLGAGIFAFISDPD